MKSVGLNIKRAFCRSKENEKIIKEENSHFYHLTFKFYLEIWRKLFVFVFKFNCFTFVSYDKVHAGH